MKTTQKEIMHCLGQVDTKKLIIMVVDSHEIVSENDSKVKTTITDIYQNLDKKIAVLPAYKQKKL